jgi:hypothetical protein
VVGKVASGTVAGAGAALFPFTFGISVLLLSPLGLVSGFLTDIVINENLKAIENELKLVREIEQAEQELNDLENKLEEEREHHIEGVRACDR